VGDTLQTKTWTFGSQSQAAAHYEKKKKEKLKVKSGRDCYTQVEVLDSTQPVTSQTAAVAERDIEYDSDTTRDLIRWLSEVNVHTILKNTTMKYDAAEGLFRTPLGVVGQSCVDRARILLSEIAPHVARQDFSDPDLTRAANEYLRLIPRNLGRARDKLKLDRIFPDNDALQAQSDILDSLQASISSMMTGPKNGPTLTTEKRAKLSRVVDQKIIKEVESLYNKTRQSIHVSHVYKPVNVYSVEIQSMKAGWDKLGSKMDNIWRLWHGTSYANLLSIIYNGLQVPTRYTNGWNFGAGLYFSDQSTKSLNYAAGYWDNSFGSKQRCFMFLADVAMGKYYHPTSSSSSRPQGYDSTFAEGGKCRHLLNNEMIVPKTGQANLVYLVEFTR
jgi:poly [ADP-ribose] polymerase